MINLNQPIIINNRNLRKNYSTIKKHFEEFKATCKICNILQKMGYLVTINLMQISEQTEEKIDTFLQNTKNTLMKKSIKII